MARPQNQRNSVLIQLTSRSIASDWILEIPADKSQLAEKWVIKVSDSRMDYLVRDIYFGLKNNTLKISLNVEYMPIVGYFFKVRPPPRSPNSTRPPTPCPPSTATKPNDCRLTTATYNDY